MRALVFCLALGLAACTDADHAAEPVPPPPAPPSSAEGGSSVRGLVAADADLGTLERLVEVAGLGDVLADTAAAYTLFAPTDAAFAAFGPDRVAALEADSAAARALLLDHVLSTRMLSVDVFPDLEFEAVGGAELTFAEVEGGLAVRTSGTTARIVTADLDASNGVVHLLDTVLAD